MGSWSQQGGGIPFFLSYRTACVAVVLLLSVLFIAGCGVNTVSKQLIAPAQIRSAQHGSGFLKAHMVAGDMYVLNDWRIDSTQTRIIGNGNHLDWNRELLDSGLCSVLLDSVVIFETNEVHPSAAVSALGLVTVASVAVSIICIANPKACFGSCPTFYVDDGDSLLLQAEGFSSSVAPSLEATDIDALYRAKFSGATTTITMTNEAYETHVVRHADLLAVEKSPPGRIMSTSDKQFWEVLESVAPNVNADQSGMGTSLVADFDGDEWFSLADSTDLSTKEEIELQFPTINGERFGIAIASRQSLMSTYLFYQTLAYMGTGAGEIFAALERRGPAMISEFRSFGEDLGNIEVLLLDSVGNWKSAGVIRETGPLATDMHLLLLPPDVSSPTSVRIRVTKGYWRLDQIALVSVGEQRMPQRIHPSGASRQGNSDPAALAALLDDALTLVTLPGDTVQLIYELPQPPQDYEYFLESRGYYLEWMRENWLEQEDRAMAMQVITNPQSALKTLAADYKRIEAQMEDYFWRSRYAK